MKQRFLQTANAKLERILSDFSESLTTPMEKTSLSPPREIKVIITLEASGSFLNNVSKVCAATGLTIEEIFEYISQAIDDRRHDQYTQSLMVDSRYPQIAQNEISGTLTDLIEMIETETGRLAGPTDRLQLLKVFEDDDAAIVEIKPEHIEALPATRAMYPRKRKVVKLPQ